MLEVTRHTIILHAVQVKTATVPNSTRSCAKKYREYLGSVHVGKRENPRYTDTFQFQNVSPYGHVQPTKREEKTRKTKRKRQHGLLFTEGTHFMDVLNTRKTLSRLNMLQLEREPRKSIHKDISLFWLPLYASRILLTGLWNTVRL